MRIAFDIGGVLSKYPDVFRPLLDVLHGSAVEVYIISDMHPVEKAIDWLEINLMSFLKHRVLSADYQAHGEMCKALLCQELGIDILVDDFPGYLATLSSPSVRLLVMPDPAKPYYHDNWKTDGSEGDFGRRKVHPQRGDILS